MLAVLKDAIYCIQGCPSTRDKMRTRLYLEARKWLMEEDSDWPFSFANICEAFGLSPQHLRAGLLRREDTILISKGYQCDGQPACLDESAPSQSEYQAAST